MADFHRRRHVRFLRQASQLDVNLDVNRAEREGANRSGLWFAKTPADPEINNLAAAIPPPRCY